MTRKNSYLLALAFLAALAAAALPATAATDDNNVRPSLLAGSWYPADPAELRRRVEIFINQGDAPKAPGPVKAVIAPHAGHVYSGAVAGRAFRILAEQDFDTLIMIGPSHRAAFTGFSINTQDYQTPLGLVRNDRELAEVIKKAAGSAAVFNPQAHDREHCLEIQLPFLQVVRPKAKIVPIIMGSHDLAACRALARALVEAVKAQPKTMLLASTDLSHFHTGPDAVILDWRLIDRVKSYDPEGLNHGIEEGWFEACGGAPLTAVMLAARELGADSSVILKYAHSGQVTGDDSSVVGYLAAALIDSKDKSASTPAARSAAEPQVGVDLGLTEDEQKYLLKLARASIEAALEDREETPSEVTPNLAAKRGAFVTLKSDGDLRGCIGYLRSNRPLAETVSHAAVAAALSDPRFIPVTRKELDGLTIEISALTPFEPVTDFSLIEIGRHGLLIVKGSYQGLLLPQVPVEQGWGREEFLSQCCRKAGLPADAWKDGAKVYRFSAQVFGEDTLLNKPQNQAD